MLETTERRIYHRFILVLMALLLVSVLYSFYLIGMMERQRKETENLIWASDLAELGVTMDSQVYGMAFGDYFCVWTKERDYSDIMQTCNHEFLHNKYWENWDHFSSPESWK